MNDLLDYSELLEFLKVGERYSIFYNEGNINNIDIEIRAIVDNYIVVYKLLKNHCYCTEKLMYFNLIYRDKNITPYKD